MKNRITIITFFFLLINIFFLLYDFPHGHIFDNFYVTEESYAFFDLNENDIEYSITTKDDGFNSYRVYAKVNNPKKGEIRISIIDNNEIIVEESFKTKDINNWIVVNTKKISNKKELRIHIYGDNCEINECTLAYNDLGILDGQGFERGTFLISEKVFLVSFGASIYLAIISKYVNEGKQKKLRYVAIFCLLFSLLGSNYTFNNIDRENIVFDSFQSISNDLVYNSIEADKMGMLLDQYGLRMYPSQVGLQGFIFRFLSRITNYYDLKFDWLCACATAITFILIAYLISKKYDTLFALVFIIVCWLSPWICNFAHSVYWVEFTWFLPMAVGLFCLINIQDKKKRMLSYLLAFITILIKSMCGYEYITSVMLGLIAFELVELLVSIVNKEKEQSKLIFKTTFFLGVFALLGFLCAITIHGTLRGEGNLLSGIIQIFNEDVLRRTTSNNLSLFHESVWDSLNASLWETVSQYFIFESNQVVVNNKIIAGVPGSLFIPLILIPIIIFVTDFWKDRLNYRDLFLYIVFFLVALSWLILAKGHSYIHVFMSFVLWYFGFIQVCFYIMVKRIIDIFKGAHS